MIAGPALGGMLGGISAHAPFIAAALLNGFAFLLACIFLKETHHSHGGTGKPVRIKPFVLLRLDDALRGLGALFAVFFIIQLIGQVPAALWVIYGEDRFQWNTATVGLSLAAFGATHAIFQAFVTGPLSSRRRAAHAAVWHGCGCDWLRSSGFCHAEMDGVPDSVAACRRGCWHAGLAGNALKQCQQ